MPKFIQSLDNQVYAELEKLAKERGITVQTLIRAVIVPEWSSITKTDIKYEKANVVSDDQPTTSHSNQYAPGARPNHNPPIPTDQQRNAPQLTESTVFHLRHFKPSTIYEEAKQEEKTEKADIVVYGRKRRHH